METVRGNKRFKPLSLEVICFAEITNTIVNPEINPKTQRNLVYDRDVHMDGEELELTTDVKQLTTAWREKKKKNQKWIFYSL